jgi:hypothetical protein
MQYVINAFDGIKHMKAEILSGILITILFTTNLVWAENLPPSSSLGVDIPQTEYAHKLPDGTTVVYGEVQNNLGSPVNSVAVAVIFMDDNSNQIEYKVGTTLVSVIPSGGKVPFAIASTKADPNITNFQVKLAGFKSSADKGQVLDVTAGALQVSEKLLISGTITNNGALKSSNTKLYLISYDAFSRIVSIGTSDPVDVGVKQDAQFSITSDSSPRAQSYMLLAESDNYESKLVPVTTVTASLPILVSGTTVTDSSGKPYDTIPANSEVNISSNVKHLVNSTQPYIYYVQVKQFDGKTAFIGKYEGVFLGVDNKNATVSWTPSTAGQYFVETYVWNYDSVPLAASVPSINVVLVK